MLISKVNDHINAAILEGKWLRCENVSLEDGILQCSLALENTYELMGAYKCDLHIRFVNAKTDGDLVGFVRSWGPLYLTEPEKQNGIASLSLTEIRRFQRWLKAFLDLLAAFKSAKSEQAALRGFIEAEHEYYGSDDTLGGLGAFKRNFGIQGTVLDWVKTADLSLVRNATDFLVPFAWVHPMNVHLVCRRQRTRRVVEPRWLFSGLEDALRWMVFYDEFTKHPVVCCRECRKVFRAESAHIRKYCSYECAHRATGRQWQQKKRKEERAAARRKGK